MYIPGVTVATCVEDANECLATAAAKKIAFFRMILVMSPLNFLFTEVEEDCGGSAGRVKKTEIFSGNRSPFSIFLLIYPMCGLRRR